MLEQVSKLGAALSDPGRLRIVNALSGGELCVCQLTELLGLAPSTVSKHLSLLRGSGLITSRKDGRWMYYRLAGRGSSPQAQRALRWTLSALAGDPQLGKDNRALEAIRAQDVEELCRK
jgi:arsenate reductase/ArsR family transcriptional regulator